MATMTAWDLQAELARSIYHGAVQNVVRAIVADRHPNRMLNATDVYEIARTIETNTRYGLNDDDRAHMATDVRKVAESMRNNKLTPSRYVAPHGARSTVPTPKSRATVNKDYRKFVGDNYVYICPSLIGFRWYVYADAGYGALLTEGVTGTFDEAQSQAIAAHLTYA